MTELICKPNLKKSGNKNTGTLRKNASQENVFFGFSGEEIESNSTGEKFLGFSIVPKLEKFDFLNFDETFPSEKEHHHNQEYNNLFLYDLEPESTEELPSEITNSKVYRGKKYHNYSSQHSESFGLPDQPVFSNSPLPLSSYKKGRLDASLVDPSKNLVVDQLFKEEPWLVSNPEVITYHPCLDVLVPFDEIRKREDITMSKLKRSRSLGDMSDPDCYFNSPVKKEPDPQNDLNVVSTINISKSPEKEQLDITVLQDSIRKVLQDTIKSDHSIRNINMKIEVITTSVTREEVEKLSNDKGSESDQPKIIINAEQKKEPEDDNISTISSLVALSSSREGSITKDLLDSPKSSSSKTSSSCSNHFKKNTRKEFTTESTVTTEQCERLVSNPENLKEDLRNSENDLTRSNIATSDCQSKIKVTSTKLIKISMKESLKMKTSQENSDLLTNESLELESTSTKKKDSRKSKVKDFENFVGSDSDLSDNLCNKKLLSKPERKFVSPKRRSLRHQTQTDLDSGRNKEIAKKSRIKKSIDVIQSESNKSILDSANEVSKKPKHSIEIIKESKEKRKTKSESDKNILEKLDKVTSKKSKNKPIGLNKVDLDFDTSESAKEFVKIPVPKKELVKKSKKKSANLDQIESNTNAVNEDIKNVEMAVDDKQKRKSLNRSCKEQFLNEVVSKKQEQEQFEDQNNTECKRNKSASKTENPDGKKAKPRVSKLPDETPSRKLPSRRCKTNDEKPNHDKIESSDDNSAKSLSEKTITDSVDTCNLSEKTILISSIFQEKSFDSKESLKEYGIIKDFNVVLSPLVFDQNDSTESEAESSTGEEELKSPQEIELETKLNLFKCLELQNVSKEVKVNLERNSSNLALTEGRVSGENLDKSTEKILEKSIEHFHHEAVKKNSSYDLDKTADQEVPENLEEISDNNKAIEKNAGPDLGNSAYQDKTIDIVSENEERTSENVNINNLEKSTCQDKNHDIVSKNVEKLSNDVDNKSNKINAVSVVDKDKKNLEENENKIFERNSLPDPVYQEKNNDNDGKLEKMFKNIDNNAITGNQTQNIKNEKEKKIHKKEKVLNRSCKAQNIDETTVEEQEKNNDISLKDIENDNNTAVKINQIQNVEMEQDITQKILFLGRSGKEPNGDDNISKKQSANEAAKTDHSRNNTAIDDIDKTADQNKTEDDSPEYTKKAPEKHNNSLKNPQPTRRNSVSDLINSNNVLRKPLSRSKSLACLKKESFNLDIDFKDVATSMLDVFAPMRITRSKVPDEYQNNTENMNSVLEGRKRANSLRRPATSMSQFFSSQDNSVGDEENLQENIRSIRSKSVPRKQFFKSLLDLETEIDSSNDDQQDVSDNELTEIDRKRKKRSMSQSPEDTRKYQRLTRSRSVGRNILQRELEKDSSFETQKPAEMTTTRRLSRTRSVSRRIIHKDSPEILKTAESTRLLRSKSVPRKVILEDSTSDSTPIDSPLLTPRVRSKSVLMRSLPTYEESSDSHSDLEAVMRRKDDTEDKLSSLQRSKSPVGRLRGTRPKKFCDSQNEVKVKNNDGEGDIGRKRPRSLSKPADQDCVDECTYKDGSFVWAQIGKYPFWPAMVCQDPLVSTFVKKAFPPSYHRSMVTQYHVRFFNDNGKRAWVTEAHLMMYCSKNDLTEMADKLKELKMKTYIKYLQPVQPRVLLSWNKAVDELEALKQKSSKEIYSHLVHSYVKHYNETHKGRKSINIEQITLERKKNESINESPPKKVRREDKHRKESYNLPLEQRIPKSQCTLPAEKINNSTKFPPIKMKILFRKNGLQSEFSSSTDDSFAEDSHPRRHKKNRMSAGKNHEKDGEIFTKPTRVREKFSPENKKRRKLRHTLPAKLQKTDSEKLSKECKIEKVIDDILRNAPPKKQIDFDFVRPNDSDTDSAQTKKKKAQNDDASPDAEIKQPIDHGKRRKNQNDDGVDVEGKSPTDRSEASKYSYEYQVELHRKNNPFNGMGRTKVCHYCLQGGELHKCKGKCGGVFHLECASKVTLPRPQQRTSKQFKKSRRSGNISTPVIGTPTRAEKGISVLSADVRRDQRKVRTSDTESTCSSRSSEKVQIVNVRSKRLTNLSNPNVPCLPPTFNQLSLDQQIDYRMKEMKKVKDNQIKPVLAKCVMSRFDEQITYADSSSTDTSSEEGSGIYSTVKKVTNHVSSVSGDGKNGTENSPSCSQPPSEKIKGNGVGSAEKPSDELSTPGTAASKEKVVKHVTADSVIVDDGTDLANFKCEHCRLDKCPPCGACGLEVSSKGVSLLHKCSQYHCNKTYHKACLKMWPQAQWSIGKWTRDQTSEDMFTCPSHVCHTCFSEELGTGCVRLPGDKLTRCLLCPASYHASTFCVPAGSEVLGGSQLICPRHRRTTQPLNTSWCFICSEGGNLVCCDMCPTSVHPECQPINFTDDDKYICEDCESGRFPLYDEVVWVKLGSYRWWPALVLFPNEVPENMLSIKHQIGDFAVRFFGTNDHYWVSKSRSFLFQEGDRGGGPEESISSKKKVYELFERAIEDAAVAFQLKRDFKLRREAESITSLKPPPFVKTLKNKPIGNVRQLELDLSNTTACECDPDEVQPCGPESDCINRLLLTECDPELCPAASRCRNQSFEQREYPPMVPYKTQGRGWGLKNLAPIKKGQFVIEYVGDLIDQEEYQRRIKKMHETKEENYYFMTLDNDRMIDAGPKGNLSRFMNHSCNPNCETQKWTVRGDTKVGLFALKEIEAGSELTFNYNLECVGQEKKTCKCGASNCSGFIGAKAKPEQDSDSSKAPIIKPRKLTKKKPKITVLPPCFICSRKAAYIACTNKQCNKHYHLRCLELTEKPDVNKYVCPRHNCNLCTNRTIRCCVKCINSFCPSHSEGHIRHDRLLGFVCRLHDPSSSDTDFPKSGTEKLDNLKKQLKQMSPPHTGENQKLYWKVCKQISRENKKMQNNLPVLNHSFQSSSTSEDDIANVKKHSEKLKARKRSKDTNSSHSDTPSPKKPHINRVSRNDDALVSSSQVKRIKEKKGSVKKRVLRSSLNVVDDNNVNTSLVSGSNKNEMEDTRSDNVTEKGTTKELTENELSENVHIILNTNHFEEQTSEISIEDNHNFAKKRVLRSSLNVIIDKEDKNVNTSLSSDSNTNGAEEIGDEISEKLILCKDLNTTEKISNDIKCSNLNTNNLETQTSEISKMDTIEDDESSAKKRVLRCRLSLSIKEKIANEISENVSTVVNTNHLEKRTNEILKIEAIEDNQNHAKKRVLRSSLNVIKDKDDKNVNTSVPSDSNIREAQDRDDETTANEISKISKIDTIEENVLLKKRVLRSTLPTLNKEISTKPSKTDETCIVSDSIDITNTKINESADEIIDETRSNLEKAAEVNSIEEKQVETSLNAAKELKLGPNVNKQDIFVENKNSSVSSNLNEGVDRCSNAQNQEESSLNINKKHVEVEGNSSSNVTEDTPVKSNVNVITEVENSGKISLVDKSESNDNSQPNTANENIPSMSDKS